jgi:hypothetical protein
VKLFFIYVKNLNNLIYCAQTSWIMRQYASHKAFCVKIRFDSRFSGRGSWPAGINCRGVGQGAEVVTIG